MGAFGLYFLSHHDKQRIARSITFILAAHDNRPSFKEAIEYNAVYKRLMHRDCPTFLDHYKRDIDKLRKEEQERRKKISEEIEKKKVQERLEERRRAEEIKKKMEEQRRK